MLPCPEREIREESKRIALIINFLSWIEKLISPFRNAGFAFAGKEKISNNARNIGNSQICPLFKFNLPLPVNVCISNVFP